MKKLLSCVMVLLLLSACTSENTFTVQNYKELLFMQKDVVYEELGIKDATEVSIGVYDVKQTVEMYGLSFNVELMFDTATDELLGYNLVSSLGSDKASAQEKFLNALKLIEEEYGPPLKDPGARTLEDGTVERMPAEEVSYPSEEAIAEVFEGFGTEETVYESYFNIDYILEEKFYTDGILMERILEDGTSEYCFVIKNAIGYYPDEGVG